MARSTDWIGVGWGQWAFHQAEAQRAVLTAFPLEAWRGIAPYFGVAPSLPFHLLAEIGPGGFFFWFVVLLLSLLGVIRLSATWLKTVSGFSFVFLATSVGTTPVQFFLTVDRENVRACDRAIETFRTTPARDLSPLSVCPEIRTIEWTAAAEGTRESFLRWHETFPQDVMPPFVLARIAARAGNESEALGWLQEAAGGDPGNDPAAVLLRDEAKRIVAGGRERLRLWTAIPSARPGD